MHSGTRQLNFILFKELMIESHTDTQTILNIFEFTFCKKVNFIIILCKWSG